MRRGGLSPCEQVNDRRQIVLSSYGFLWCEAVDCLLIRFFVFYLHELYSWSCFVVFIIIFFYSFITSLKTTDTDSINIQIIDNIHNQPPWA